MFFCWLTLNDHRALKIEAPPPAKMIPAYSKPTCLERRSAVIPPSSLAPKEARMLCWLAYVDHEALYLCIS